MAGGALVGVDLGGTKVTVGAVDDGHLRAVHSRPVSSSAAQEVVVEEVCEAIAEVFGDGVMGIGCAVPSVVDTTKGVVFDVENIPSWKRVPLRALLEERFRVPAFINNDANAFAVGEHAFGQGRAFSNLVGITLGTGLGAGVIIGGRLYSGGNCGAGEIGSIPYRDGTIEDYCAGGFFTRQCGDRGEVLQQRARAGDDEALSCFARFGRELAHAIAVVLFAFDPEAIILGGSVSSAFDLFASSMWAGLESFPYRHVVEKVVISRSEMEHVAVLGAAALYLDATGAGGGRPVTEERR